MNLEAKYFLRRLSDPLPVDVSTFDPTLQLLVLGSGAVLGLLLVGLLFRTDRRKIFAWAIPVALLRLTSLLGFVVALAFPGMVIGEWENAAWLVVTGAALCGAFSFVLALYVMDSRSVGWWSLPLAVLRCCVYLLLTIAFLLPAIQYWELTEKRSRVVIVLDVSPSVSLTSDDTTSIPGQKPKTRLQKILDFLTDEQVGFVKNLLDKNPVYLYRFGARLDDESSTLEQDKSLWSRQEWDSWVNYDFKPWVLRGVSPAGQEAVMKSVNWKASEAGNADWAMAWSKSPEEDAVPVELADVDKATLKENRAKIEKRIDVARAIVLGTNVPDSLTALVNRETSNMVQGVIVFSDGRSNLGSESAFKMLKDRAAREKIPLFTVAVGEARENVSIVITDVQAPDRTAPDEQFKIVVEADGLGLADTEVDVMLSLYLPGRDTKKDAPDHELTAVKLKFAGDSNPPHGQAEFFVDPDKLPDTLTENSKKLGKRKQLKPGAWNVVARIARDKRELSPDAEHISPSRLIQILDKPTRILLFASGPTREYQTLRTLLVRETAQNRAELSICLQNEGGREGTGVQDVPAERLLSRFPTRLDITGTNSKPEDKYYNLHEYDLVIAFDPDWSELSADQIKNLQTWVDNLGGGFIYVAGPLHTYQLARADDTGRVKPLLDILPVVPEDIILVKTKPIPRTPRRVLLKPNPEFDVLKLEDDPADDPVAGWEAFFTGRDKFAIGTTPRENLTPTRGFYSYYPLKMTKPGSSTLAEFLDTNDRGDPDPKPWLVTTQPARGRTVFLGSGEIWRFRAYNQDFFDRFWVKLSRYAAGNRDAKASRGRVLIGKEFLSGSQIRVQARLLSPNGQPYDMNTISPKFRIEQFNANNEKEKELGPFEMRAKKGGNEFDGYYAGQVLADPSRLPPGDKRYRVVIDVPDSAGDTITGDFILKKSDPELDNTRPDFAALEQVAGTLEEVRGRIKDPGVLEKLKGSEHDFNRVKLAFRLSETEKLAMIPACMDATSQTFRNRGAVKDLWDRPLAIPFGDQSINVLDAWLFGYHLEVGWLLLAIVLLLTVEWLTRKLLRLA